MNQVMTQWFIQNSERVDVIKKKGERVMLIRMHQSTNLLYVLVTVYYYYIEHTFITVPFVPF